MDRRKFLATLGIGGGSIAFTASHPWIFPETVIPYSGPFSFEWMASEITATIAAKLHGMKFHTDPDKYTLRNWSGAKHEYCHFFIGLKEAPTLSLEKIRTKFIIPTASAMAQRIIEIHPKTCGVLPLPKAIDIAHSCTDKTTGLNMRFLRAYDIGYDRYINRCDVLIA